MKIEELGVDKRDKPIRKRAFHRRRPQRRVQAETAAIQRLFEASKVIFKGPAAVPPPQDVKMLQMLIDKLRAGDFGLSGDLDFSTASSPSNGTPAVTFTTIYSCDRFSICLFFLPPTAIIPLHNHPEMTVFNKLLLGTMHITSYDWVDPPISKEVSLSNFRLARMVVDSDFTAPCKTCTLYPAAGGNMHTFRAVTPCVVLDVLGPPYSKEDDRDCTYYRAHPFSHVSDGSSGNAGDSDKHVCWLEEIEMPKESRMVGIEYMGPQIIDS